MKRFNEEVYTGSPKVIYVDRWWLKEGWYTPDLFLSNSTLVLLASSRITRSPSKKKLPGQVFAKDSKLTHLAYLGISAYREFALQTEVGVA